MLRTLSLSREAQKSLPSHLFASLNAAVVDEEEGENFRAQSDLTMDDFSRMFNFLELESNARNPLVCPKRVFYRISHINWIIVTSLNAAAVFVPRPPAAAQALPDNRADLPDHSESERELFVRTLRPAQSSKDPRIRCNSAFCAISEFEKNRGY